MHPLVDAVTPFVTRKAIEHRRVLGAGAAGTAMGVAGTLALRHTLHRQAQYARDIIGKPHGDLAPNPNKTYGASRGRPVDLVLLGDSIAAGLGSDRRSQTTGARIAKRVSKRIDRAVRLRSVAVVGAETSDLTAQISRLPRWYSPKVAVVIVGGNDVTHRVKVSSSVASLRDSIVALQERGAVVVVGLCPDLAAIRPLPQPLRGLASRASRQLASAQREAALDMGAYAVSISDVAGPFFLAHPDVMFSGDQFHPSPLGYKRIAKAIAPSVVHALGARESLPFGHHYDDAESLTETPNITVNQDVEPVTDQTASKT